MLSVKVKGEHFESVATVILRVPGLFILDYWWQYDLHKSWPLSLEWPELLSCLVTNIMVLQGLLLLLLPLEHLVTLYMHYIGGALLAAADGFSRQYILSEQQMVKEMPHGALIETKLEEEKDMVFMKRQFSAVVVHIVIASSVSFLLDIECNLHRAIMAIYTVPVAARIASFPVTDLHVVHNFASAFVILTAIYYILSLVPCLLEYTKEIYIKTLYKIKSFGGVHILSELWNHLFVPIQFLVFWSVLLAAQLYRYIYHPDSHIILMEEWYIILLSALSEICASPVSLLGTCVAVSYFSYLSLSLTRLYIQGYNAFITDQLMHAGMTEGLIMILLAIQTGLIEIKMPHRLAAMSIILFIVVASLIQSMYEVTEPVLLALSASQSRTVTRHLRALSLCFFLFSFPLYMTYMLCYVFDIDFWTLVVISTCVMTSVQVIGLLVVYGLFTYDAFCAEPWDTLDDVVYYARAVTRVLEFVVAVFVVGAGIRESFLGQWSWISSSVLLIHCYFNVWQRLQSGWKSFLQRREAVHKINSLPKAGEKELEQNNDVCAICYMEMKTARITECKHFFHGACLRKWLYVQDKCPLCSSIITLEKDESSEEDQGNYHDQVPNENPGGHTDMMLPTNGEIIPDSTTADNIYQSETNENSAMSQGDAQAPVDVC